MSIYYIFYCSICIFFIAKCFIFAPEMKVWIVQLECMQSTVVVSHTRMR